MSAELMDAFDGIVTIEVVGKLTPDELAEAHRDDSGTGQTTARRAGRQWDGP